MRIYADTSFLVKLITEEADSDEARAEFRHLDSQRIFYTPLHSLELTNAIRGRAYHKRQNSPPEKRHQILRERDTALTRIQSWLARSWFIPTAVDFGEGFDRARELSEQHTERLGCRGFDLLHVAVALELQCEVFLTSDFVQASLARAEGLDVRISSSAE